MTSSPSTDYDISKKLANVAARILILSLSLACPLSAQDSKNGKLTERFDFHVYLTLAYGKTDGNQILGLSEDGTSDYHDLALQLRSRLASKHYFITMVTRESKGDIPESEVTDEVDLDWLFYRGQLSDSTTLKVGRAPLPIGIYNEIRDVGTILPFFEPPYSIYQEASFTSEYIDGLVLSQSLFAQKPWPLEVDLYYGTWKFSQRSGGSVGEAEAEDAFGLQVWIGTPVPELRLGFGANRYDVVDGILQIGPSDEWRSLVLSLDGDFDRFLVRAEYNIREVEISLGPVPLPEFEAEGIYLQAGYHFTERFSGYAQYDLLSIKTNSPLLPVTGSVDIWRDVAVGLSYSFPRQFVLKLEYHENEGYLVDNDPSVNFIASPPARTNYGLLSLAFSF